MASIGTLLSAIFMVFALSPTYAFDCSDIHIIESEGVLNYLAKVTITVPSTAPNGWNIWFVFDRNFTGIGVWDGFITYSDADKEQGLARMYNKTEEIKEAGEEFSFRFRINWPEPRFIQPVLTSLSFGSEELCK